MNEMLGTRTIFLSPVSLVPRVSTDLESWVDAEVLSSNSVLVGGNCPVQAVEDTITIQATNNPFFARIEAAWTGRTWTSEVLWKKISTGGIYLWEMTGTNRDASVVVDDSVSTSWIPQDRGDFDGNGQDDLLFRNSSTGNMVFYLMHGMNYDRYSYTNTPPSVSTWTIETIGDFDGDGKDDLLWRRRTDGCRAIWYMNGGERAGMATIVDTLSSSWNMQRGYFNDDNKADLLVRNSTTGDTRIWIMDGSTVVTNAFVATVADHWSVQGVGDFDGDRKDDILWQNSSTGDLYIWFMDGMTLLSGAAIEVYLSLNWRVERVMDFNGDHKMDIFLRNTSTYMPVVWIMDGSARVAIASYPDVNPSQYTVIP